MSDHLPGRLEDWPDDPFGLLGIDPDADAKTARRAYAQLIRNFKPDHAPEAFQKIRSAYEGAVSLIAMRDEYGLDLTAAPPGDDRAAAPGDQEPSAADDAEPGDLSGAEDPSSTDEVAEDARLFARFPSTGEDEVLPETADAWELAKRGQRAEARRSLEALLKSEPASSDVIVRLYWLRRLDGEESIALIRWLSGLAVRNGCRGMPWQILLTELDVNPAASQLTEIGELVTVGRPDRLAALLQLRWKNAGLKRQWEVIERDLETVRPRFAVDFSVDWAGLLVVALRCLVWQKLDAEEQGDRGFESLASELNGFQELHLQLPHFFDEAEELQELRTEIDRDERQIPPLILQAVREETLSPEPVLRQTLIRIADEWTRSPSMTLLNLEHLASVRPVLFGRLWRSLARYSSVRPEPPEEHLETIGRQIGAFVAKTNWYSDTWRLEVVEFCTRECLAVETIVRLVLASPDIPSDFANGLAQHLYSDSALRCLTEGLQMLQSV